MQSENCKVTQIMPVEQVILGCSDDLGPERPENDPGRYERRLILSITGPQERLPYPTHTEEVGTRDVEVYDIPEEDRAKVLDDLYLSSPTPGMDDTLLDIHEGRTFRVGDFMVTREDDSNFLVSPYYLRSGGSQLDWVPLNSNEDDEDENDNNDKED